MFGNVFFSMIRAPNQLLPKTKVVDLFFLYNFYFGQISSAYMKFGVSVGQTGVKIIQTSKQFSCSSTVLARRLTAAVAAGERRHALAIAPRRRSSPR